MDTYVSHKLFSDKVPLQKFNCIRLEFMDAPYKVK